jgi:DNA/RNA-binding domain of Phe-tRNA-synthetase-like protein
VVYKDDAGAICRCWNWRESARTLLKEKTTNGFLCIESVDQGSDEPLRSALEELKKLVKLHLNGQCDVHILDFNNRSIVVKK